MELKLKMHNIEICIKKDYDDADISQMFEIFETLLIGVTFPPEVIKRYYIERCEQEMNNN